MLKKMIKDNTVNIQRMLLKDYVRMGLNETEVVVLMHLFMLFERNKTMLSVSGISRLLTLDATKTADVLDGLIEKGYIDITIETNKEGKEKEVFNLDGTLKIITENYVHDLKSERKETEDNAISQTIDLFEKELKRPLSHKELETIRAWFNEGVTLQEIKEALLIALRHQKASIAYIDGILCHEKQEKTMSSDTEPIDEETARALDDFFHDIK